MYGALLADFQPDFLNPFVLKWRCLLYPFSICFCDDVLSQIFRGFLYPPFETTGKNINIFSLHTSMTLREVLSQESALTVCHR